MVSQRQSLLALGVLGLIGGCAGQLTNPVLWEDYPDIDVFRVGDVFYYSSSTFAFSPGAPILKSYDLANWTPVSHSVPRLDFGSKYDIASETDRAYVQGIWASTLRYRESNDKFYWLGCISGGGTTYVYTSSGGDAAGNNGEVSSWDWEQSGSIGTCYYDCGLLIDEDDTMYVAYGNTAIHVAQLSADGLSEVRNEQVISGSTTIEGSHMYKINGYYWIVPTKPASAEYVYRASSPWGPYEQRTFFDSLSGPLEHAGYAHQGGMVDLPDGTWWYVAFLDSFPSGRIPVAAPIQWSSDGWPSLVLDNGAWGKTYDMPVDTDKTVPPPTGTDNFDGSALSDEWEWNHNPDNDSWELGSDGVVLNTASVTDDLYSARNTLTHRTLGPESIATFEFSIDGMADGDRAGAVLLRDKSAYIGVHRDGDDAEIVFVDGLALNSNWQTSSKGSVTATGPVVGSGGKVWLRIDADITPAFGLDPVRQAKFSYSTDGSQFTELGSPLVLTNDWTFFSGYRFAAFNFATKQLGGHVTLNSFSMELA